MKFYYLKHWKSLLGATISSVIEMVCFIVVSLEMGKVVDAALAFQLPLIFQSAAWIAIGLLLSLGIHYVEVRMMCQFAFQISEDLRIDLLRSFYAQSWEKFRQHKEEYYLNLLDEDLDELRVNYLVMIPLFCTEAVKIVLTLGALLWIHPWMFFLAVGFSVLPMLVSRLFLPKLKKLSEIRSEVNESYLWQLREVIAGYEVIQRTNRKESFFCRFSRANQQRTAILTKQNLWTNMSQHTMYLIRVISNLLMVVLGGYLIVRGELTAGILMSSINLLTSTADFVANTTEYFLMIRSNRSLVEKIEPFLDNVPPASSFSGEISPQAATVKLDHLSFSYEEKEILSHLDYVFEAEKCYAIIGETGSGKSTLLHLLLGEQTGYSGRILLDGKELQKYSREERYARIGVVGQHPILFRMSLFQNIALFNESLKEDSPEYQAILKKAHLLDLAKRVGEQEVIPIDDLSGGEQQRISLARMLVRKPQLLLLDEPTSALDPDTAHIINEVIFSMEGVTRIVVTHDWMPAYLQRFDGILSLDKGGSDAN